jgi:beta-glucosidase
MHIFTTLVLILLGVMLAADLAIGIFYLAFRIRFILPSKRNLASRGPDDPLLEINGLQFRDLNKNGVLDIYEDFRRSIGEQIDDLLSKITLEEKVGMLFQPMITAALEVNL